jgi:hypothetical protein
MATVVGVAVVAAETGVVLELLSLAVATLLLGLELLWAA